MDISISLGKNRKQLLLQRQDINSKKRKGAQLSLKIIPEENMQLLLTVEQVMVMPVKYGVQ